MFADDLENEVRYHLQAIVTSLLPVLSRLTDGI